MDSPMADDLISIPDEILIEIFTFIPAYELHTILPFVCRRWNVIINHLWSQFNTAPKDFVDKLQEEWQEMKKIEHLSNADHASTLFLKQLYFRWRRDSLQYITWHITKFYEPFLGIPQSKETFPQYLTRVTQSYIFSDTLMRASTNWDVQWRIFVVNCVVDRENRRLEIDANVPIYSAYHNYEYMIRIKILCGTHVYERLRQYATNNFKYMCEVKTCVDKRIDRLFETSLFQNRQYQIIRQMRKYSNEQQLEFPLIMGSFIQVQGYCSLIAGNFPEQIAHASLSSTSAPLLLINAYDIQFVEHVEKNVAYDLTQIVSDSFREKRNQQLRKYWALQGSQPNIENLERIKGTLVKCEGTILAVKDELLYVIPETYHENKNRRQTIVYLHCPVPRHLRAIIAPDCKDTNLNVIENVPLKNMDRIVFLGRILQGNTVLVDRLDLVKASNLLTAIRGDIFWTIFFASISSILVHRYFYWSIKRWWNNETTLPNATQQRINRIEEILKEIYKIKDSNLSSEVLQQANHEIVTTLKKEFNVGYLGHNIRDEDFIAGLFLYHIALIVRKYISLVVGKIQKLLIFFAASSSLLSTTGATLKHFSRICKAIYISFRQRWYQNKDN